MFISNWQNYGTPILQNWRPLKIGGPRRLPSLPNGRTAPVHSFTRPYCFNNNGTPEYTNGKMKKLNSCNSIIITKFIKFYNNRQVRETAGSEVVVVRVRYLPLGLKYR